jgi:hypothetical protein
MAPGHWKTIGSKPPKTTARASHPGRIYEAFDQWGGPSRSESPAARPTTDGGARSMTGFSRPGREVEGPAPLPDAVEAEWRRPGRALLDHRHRRIL